MSEKKHKSRVVHVDKLIVHADDVVIIPKRRPFDPWMFGRANRPELEAAEDIQDDTAIEEVDDDDKRRNPFSWI
ncbi:hypothetical protein B0I26_12239 [Anoxybacillus vitaminiphilus]|uniref:Uncharacterized protein n=1 Tax=Paranoxybacillus vitaminiphilus TaxID=581036 RepID=A0A327Y4J0_9BACL|nr:hypothetical protein [Anoxybacillus vitaminiphilus]RAK15347.1 hypothetical protein B0I26_12239 [Anoxybacillus vitaminiphilus]